MFQFISSFKTTLGTSLSGFIATLFSLRHKFIDLIHYFPNFFYEVGHRHLVYLIDNGISQYSLGFACSCEIRLVLSINVNCACNTFRIVFINGSRCFFNWLGELSTGSHLLILWKLNLVAVSCVVVFPLRRVPFIQTVVEGANESTKGCHSHFSAWANV